MSNPNVLHLVDKKPPGSTFPTKQISLEKLFEKHDALRDAVWFIDKRSVFQKLVHFLATRGGGVLPALKKGVVLIVKAKVRKNPSDRTLEPLFQSVVPLNSETDLSFEEISSIVRGRNPENFVIAGSVNEDLKTVTLYRGDLSSLLVSFEAFPANAKTKPDFSKFRVIDGGTAIRFGDYEASISPILYEHDPLYRREISRQRKEAEKSFGACLTRARKVRKLNQDDFPGVRRETILRIENSKTKRIQFATKTKILEKLNLTEKELLEY